MDSNGKKVKKIHGSRGSPSSLEKNGRKRTKKAVCVSAAQNEEGGICFYA